MVKKCLKVFFLSVFSNPIFTTALICAAIFYSSNINLGGRERFICLFYNQDISFLSGKIKSNPVKSSSQKTTYTADFLVNEAISTSGARTSCKGKVKVFIPQNLVESTYPGKLYTTSLQNLQKKDDASILFENGNNFIFEVKHLDFSGGDLPFFYVAKAQSLGFNTGFFGRVQKIRALSRLKFKRLMYGWNEAGSLLLALLSGSKEYTQDHIQEAFKSAGLSHILALSGMHLSLFGSLAFFIGNKVTKRSFADFFELSAILFFVWFSGLSPSLFRALITSSISFINSILRMKRFKGLTVLSISFLLHSMIFPQHLLSLAFMLSYGALFGIMTLGQIIKTLLGKSFYPWISSRISESAGAQIFTAPITLYFLNNFAPIGIISSIFLSPFITLFLYLGLFATIICLIQPFLSEPFSVIMSCICKVVSELVLFFAKFPSINF